ncbi:unnamed protein product [Cuscuta campestris]|uniref:Retrotransposon Copia-like N-terminal domain-containing protein n=1 Tax=Cuscuta campestris TaxID=132261 RepID=A0A484LNK2_9ASTE|nr:unnamed protein product [Cuscuta campestris]
MADENSSSGKVTSTSDNSSSNNSPHLAFTTISNIKLHIPVQLSLSEPNYKKWSRLFCLLILCFNLKGFIDGTTIASSANDAEWYQFDALIQGWILSTITDEVFDLVLANNLSAHALWKVIYNLFHDNKHARAMQLEHRFRTTVKGNRSINEYYRLLKNLSEFLDDVDAPVTEHALVLQQQSDSIHGAGASPTAFLSTGSGGGFRGGAQRQDKANGHGCYGGYDRALGGGKGRGRGRGGGGSQWHPSGQHYAKNSVRQLLINYCL